MSQANEQGWRTVREQLSDVRRAARKRRILLSGPPLAISLVLLTVGAVLIVESLTVLMSALWIAGAMMIALSLPLVLLALLPSDSRAIKFAGTAISTAALILGFYCLGLARLAAAAFRTPACSATDPIYSDFLQYLVVGCSWIVLSAYGLYSVAQAFRGRLWPSALGLRLHRMLGIGNLGFGAVILWGTVQLVLRSPPVFRTVHFVGNVVLGTYVSAIGALELTNDVRARLHGWLAERGELMSSAAAIAAMLHSEGIEEVLTGAASRMRCVRVDALKPDDLRRNVYALSTPARFADVDAFITHSHHDPPAPKWAALQAWRRQFVHTHGREPTVWLDTCCIAVAEAWTDVANLPCYIAGCNELVILAGPSFLSRMWTTVEVFCYTHMRGATESITLYELPGFERERASASYDAHACVASRREDYFRLLACIESACDGGIDAFNSEMRSLLLSVPARRAVAAADGGAPGPSRLTADVAPFDGIVQVDPTAADNGAQPELESGVAEFVVQPVPSAGVAQQQAGGGGRAAAPQPRELGLWRLVLHRLAGRLPGRARRARGGDDHLGASRTRARVARPPGPAAAQGRCSPRARGVGIALVAAYAVALVSVLVWATAPAEADCRACVAFLEEQLPSGGARAGAWLAPSFANRTSEYPSEYLFSGLGGSARAGESSWGGALRACREEGGSLVAIGSAIEDRFVYCVQRVAAYGAWIGYTRARHADATAGGWVWARGAPLGGSGGGTPAYRNWAEGEPAADGACAIIGGQHHGWSAVQCTAPARTYSDLRAYVCERAARPARRPPSSSD